MSADLQWFESVCVSLNTDPAAATAQITEFREQDFALEACHRWLPDSSPVAKFQLALVLQHSSMKNWVKLPAETVQSLRDTMWSLISDSIAKDNMPSFALNKIMQVFALLYKRGWTALSAEQQQGLFIQISALLQHADASNNTINQKSFVNGALLLTTIIEEFSTNNTSDAGIPLEVHTASHDSFQKQGLGEALRIGISALNSSLQVRDVEIRDMDCWLYLFISVS